MADPRNTVSYTRNQAQDETYIIDASTITFDVTKVNGSAQVGLAVTLSGNNTIKLTEDGEFVLGKLMKVEGDGKAAVQESGFMTLPGGASASLTRGKGVVGALGASSAKGYIREVATATAAELGRQRGYIQDVSDTANVLVKL